MASIAAPPKIGKVARPEAERQEGRFGPGRLARGCRGGVIGTEPESEDAKATEGEYQPSLAVPNNLALTRQ